ncbi:unnamed protein product [Prorocentrum cordatum]|uniref:ABM domain-containing protein n=1 Tax=Prorocentrum cordatum TaxID=2364126 RepID=A0ABN9W6T8_9DINO|nr:unnamed protein product [Polarella glacialis]
MTGGSDHVGSKGAADVVMHCAADDLVELGFKVPDRRESKEMDKVAGYEIEPNLPDLGYLPRSISSSSLSRMKGSRGAEGSENGGPVVLVTDAEGPNGLACGGYGIVATVIFGREARLLWEAGTRLVQVQGFYRSKVISLEDNMPCSCAIAKGGSAAGLLNFLLRRRCALCAAAELRLLLPWVEAWRMPADWASRSRTWISREVLEGISQGPVQVVQQHREGVEPFTPDQWDGAIMDFKRFGGSEAVGMGVLTKSKFTLLLAAVEFRFPRMKGGLCRVKAALKGWDYARQPRRTVHMISNVCAWMCIHFCASGVPRLGFGIVIQGKFGMGPSEMLGVEADDVTLPEDWGYPGGSGPVVIGLGARAMTTAKRPQSVSFLEEQEPGLAEGLRILRRRTPKGQRNFPFSLAQYRGLIKTVQASCNLDVGWAQLYAQPICSLPWTGPPATGALRFAVPSMAGTRAPSGVKAPRRKGAAAQARGEGAKSGSEAGSWLEASAKMQAAAGRSLAKSLKSGKGGQLQWLMKCAPSGPLLGKLVLAAVLLGILPASLFPTTARGLVAMTDVAEEVGAAAGKIVTAGATVSTSVAKLGSAVTDGSIGLVEAAWRGVDLMDVHVQGSTGRFFVEDEDDWPAFLQEPEVQRVMQLEPEFSDELERLLLFSSATRPRGEFTHSAFRSPNMYQSVSFWVRWLPSGHVGIAWRVVAIRFRPQWANPAWWLLGMDESAEAPTMAEQLKVLSESCFPAPELDLGPEALRGGPRALEGVRNEKLDQQLAQLQKQLDNCIKKLATTPIRAQAEQLQGLKAELANTAQAINEAETFRVELKANRVAVYQQVDQICNEIEKSRMASVVISGSAEFNLPALMLVGKDAIDNMLQSEAFKEFTERFATAQAQAPAATGPPAYGKASTAPTASAAPVIEGMPTPWPLPSSTQQLGSTTKSVAAANKAVQQGSLGSGQVPLGDPMPAHELSHVQGVLSMLLEASAQDGNAKKREDIAKRLEILYSRLSSGQMKNSTSQKVLQLVKAIEAQDYATAGRLQADLSSNDWEIANMKASMHITCQEHPSKFEVLTANISAIAQGQPIDVEAMGTSIQLNSRVEAVEQTLSELRQQMACRKELIHNSLEPPFQRLFSPLWVVTLDALKQTGSWSEEYKLGANCYRKDLNVTSAEEMRVLFRMKIDAKVIVEYVPNVPDLVEWGISEDEARNLIKAAEACGETDLRSLCSLYLAILEGIEVQEVLHANTEVGCAFFDFTAGGPLFAFALDPFVRAQLSELPVDAGELGAFADDIGQCERVGVVELGRGVPFPSSVLEMLRVRDSKPCGAGHVFVLAKGRRTLAALGPRAPGLAALAAALAGAGLAGEAFVGLAPRGATAAGARAARAARAAEKARAAYVAVVDCSVKAGGEEEFIEATLANCRKSFFEEWCQRYDFLQSTEDPTQFALLEVYRKPIGPVEHFATQHYMDWADSVKPLMTSDRSSTQWDTICPPLASGYVPNALVLESSVARVFDVTYVYIDVKPGSEDAFIEATMENVEKSLMEPDNLRFDFLRSVDEPNRRRASIRPASSTSQFSQVSRRPSDQPTTVPRLWARSLVDASVHHHHRHHHRYAGHVARQSEYDPCRLTSQVLQWNCQRVARQNVRKASDGRRDWKSHEDAWIRHVLDKAAPAPPPPSILWSQVCSAGGPGRPPARAGLEHRVGARLQAGC